MTGLLFDSPTPVIPDIPGLSYVPDFITAREERALIEAIDRQPWLNDLKRQVQHYGYKYDYKARTVTKDTYLGPLPEWIESATRKLPFKTNQAIVNEYKSGQGISAHVDCVPCFDDTIASLSLGSGAILLFLPPYSPDLNPIENDFGALKKNRQYNNEKSIDDIIKAYK